MRQQGKLLNREGEIVAEGACELSEPAPGGFGVTMWIPSERALLERQQGSMTLMLEDGAALEIAEERRLKFRINALDGASSFVYKLLVVEREPLAPGAHPPMVQESLPDRQAGLPTEEQSSPARR